MATLWRVTQRQARYGQKKLDKVAGFPRQIHPVFSVNSMIGRRTHLFPSRVLGRGAIPSADHPLGIFLTTNALEYDNLTLSSSSTFAIMLNTSVCRCWSFFRLQIFSCCRHLVCSGIRLRIPRKVAVRASTLLQPTRSKRVSKLSPIDQLKGLQGFWIDLEKNLRGWIVDKNIAQSERREYTTRQYCLIATIFPTEATTPKAKSITVICISSTLYHWTRSS